MFLSSRMMKLLVVLHDLIMIVLAWVSAYWVYHNLAWASVQHFPLFSYELLIVLLIQFSCCYAFGLYRGVWRFASMPDLMRIIKAILLGTFLIIAALSLKNRIENIPRSVFFIYAILAVFLLGGSRFAYRWLKDYLYLFGQGKRVLIVGAGAAGEGLVRDMFRRSNREYIPVAFVDDDIRKIGQEIHGVRVLGYTKQIAKLCKRYDIHLIILALPSASSKQLRYVMKYCEEVALPYYVLPGLMDLASGRVSVNQLRKLSLEDLLGRDPVSLDWQLIRQSFQGNVILITGAGGSIGSELSRQIAKYRPSLLILVDQSEFNLYKVTMDLSQQYPGLNMKSHLLDIKDQVEVKKVFAEYRVDMVFHAAAYKHVPLLESQALVALKNNYFGTRVVAEVASQAGVKKFIFISTDKAVNPTNIMGATKRAAEVFCQTYDTQVDTQFMIVRFGNVLGSAGSVVPLFQAQLEAGGPLTVTHPEIERFFMTIPEACQLIMQTATVGQGGEIFVLDMGEPVKIKYLAEQMIKLSGHSLDEIEITYVGLRPGEKLYEELFYGSEKLEETGHPKLLKALSNHAEMNRLKNMIDQLSNYSEEFDEISAIKFLKQFQTRAEKQSC